MKSANQNVWCVLTEYSINIGYYTGNSLDHPLFGFRWVCLSHSSQPSHLIHLILSWLMEKPPLSSLFQGMGRK